MGVVVRWQKNISLQNIEKIAVALNVPIGELFDFGEPYEMYSK